MRTSKPISVTLGRQQSAVDRRIKSGEYDNASEVLRHALRALDREEAALNDVLRDKIKAAMADSRPSAPASDVFKRLRAHHAKMVKAAAREA